MTGGPPSAEIRIRKTGQIEPKKFTRNPIHKMPGINNWKYPRTGNRPVPRDREIEAVREYELPHFETSRK